MRMEQIVLTLIGGKIFNIIGHKPSTEAKMSKLKSIITRKNDNFYIYSLYKYPQENNERAKLES